MMEKLSRRWSKRVVAADAAALPVSRLARSAPPAAQAAANTSTAKTNPRARLSWPPRVDDADPDGAPRSSASGAAPSGVGPSRVGTSRGRTSAARACTPSMPSRAISTNGQLPQSSLLPGSQVSSPTLPYRALSSPESSSPESSPPESSPASSVHSSSSPLPSCQPLPRQA